MPEQEFRKLFCKQEWTCARSSPHTVFKKEEDEHWPYALVTQRFGDHLIKMEGRYFWGPEETPALEPIKQDLEHLVESQAYQTEQEYAPPGFKIEYEIGEPPTDPVVELVQIGKPVKKRTRK